MPTIIPSYMYSIFAALLVGGIIIYSCSVSTINIKNQALNQQLTNIDRYVATQSLMMISQTTENNQNNTQSIDIPPQIGNQLFWVRITNDTSGAWVESGYGTDSNQSRSRVRIPAQVAASGTFVSGSGQALLVCYLENQTLNLTLTKE